MVVAFAGGEVSGVSCTAATTCNALCVVGLRDWSTLAMTLKLNEMECVCCSCKQWVMLQEFAQSWIELD